MNWSLTQGMGVSAEGHTPGDSHRNRSHLCQVEFGSVILAA